MTTGVEKLGWLGRTHISGFLKSWGIPSRHHACFNTKHGHPLDDARGYPHDFGNLYSIKRLINPISYPIISHHIYSHCLPICKKTQLLKFDVTISPVRSKLSKLQTLRDTSRQKFIQLFDLSLMNCQMNCHISPKKYCHFGDFDPIWEDLK